MLVGGVIKGGYGLAACWQLAQLTTSQESAISDREAMTELGLEPAALPVSLVSAPTRKMTTLLY
jgi:hypothetical protein